MLSRRNPDHIHRFEYITGGQSSAEDWRQINYPAPVLDLLLNGRSPGVPGDLWGATLDREGIDEDRFRRELERINPIEADILELTLQGVTQQCIANFFGVTQTAICYRIRHGLKVMRFRMGLPEVTEDEIRKGFGAWMSEEKLEIFILYHELHNMKKVCRQMGRKHSATTAFVKRALRILEGEKNRELDRLVAYFWGIFAYHTKRLGPKKLKCGQDSTSKAGLSNHLSPRLRGVTSKNGRPESSPRTKVFGIIGP